MPQCLISFGANMGAPLETIRKAADALQAKLQCFDADFRMSRFFHTPPVGGPSGQPPFINAVVAATTDLSPWEVWQAVRDVEELLGRERMRRWEARRIDLDILLYDDLRLWTPQLKIPHPRMCMRRFILEPAVDVAADWIDPVWGCSLGHLARRLRGTPGNFLLLAASKSQPDLLLESVARATLATWNTITPNADGNFEITGCPGASRGVAWLASESLEGRVGTLHLTPPPKLVIILADANEASGAAWEDLHRNLAEQLRLSPVKSMEHVATRSDSISPRTWSLDGARYLLATDDREWAIHEMVAALEAMDCPVEPLDV